MTPTPGLARRAASATWWSTLEIAARYGVQFVVTVVLARLLSPEDFGLIAILLIFISLGSLLVDSGFGTALIQRQQPTDDDETSVFAFSLCAGLIVAVLLALSAPIIARFFDQPSLTPLIRFMALVLPLGALSAVPDALLSMRLDFRKRTIAEVVSSCASGAVALSLAASGWGVWSLAWQAVIAIATRAGILWVASGWRPRGSLRLSSLRSLSGFGGYMLLAGLLDTVSVRLQSLLIGKLFDSRQLGFYTLGQSTQQAPASFMGGILTRVGLPVFSVVAHDRAKLKQALRVSLRAAMFLFVPCMLGLAIVAKPLVLMLYGERWLPAAAIMSVLAVGTSLWPVHVLNLAAVSAQGRADLFFRLELIKKTFAIFLVAASCAWGPLAIAWATLVGSLFAALINTHYSGKFLGYGAGAQLRDQAATITLSLVAAVPGWLILHFYPPGSLPMIAALLVSATTYAALATVLGHKALVDLVDVLRSLRQG